MLLVGINPSWNEEVLTHNRNVVLLVRTEHGQELLTLAVIKSHRVILEVAVKVHVVNIRPSNISITSEINPRFLASPDILQRNLIIGVVFDNLLNHAPVRIAPSTLMKPESKVLLHCWQSCRTRQIRRGDVCLSWSGKEIKINAASQLPPRNVGWAKQNFLAMCVAIVDAVGIGDVVS